jgi:hypothetical protein
MTRIALIATLLLLPVAEAGASVWSGNDTGGIIAWSPAAEHAARETAAAHCAGYDKFARITGVRRQYGNYISFNCLWHPRIARSALPEVRTRTYRSVRSTVVVRARY